MDTIKVLFAGDFAPCHKFENLGIDSGRHLIDHEISKLAQDADISFINLECPLTKSNSKKNKSGPSIKADPRCIDIIKNFNLVGLANNHILDYGEKGLIETIKVCKDQNKNITGAGKNLSESAIFFEKTIQDVKIAIIAVAECEFNHATESSYGCSPLDVIENSNRIACAKKNNDIVLVTIHGGNEFFPYPRPGLRKICKFFIDQGADSVICHHTHVPGAYETYHGKPIFYSLGNFLFGKETDKKQWDKGYMVRLNISRSKKNLKGFDIFFTKQSEEIGGVKLLNEEENFKQQKIQEEINKKLKSSENYNDEWNKFTKKMSKAFIARNYSNFQFKGLGALAKYSPYTKFLLNDSNLLMRLNMLRCESHRELLISILEDKANSD